MNEQITTIIVSVLSTLGVVAFVITGVVTFRKIKGKADAVYLDACTNELHKRIDEYIELNTNSMHEESRKTEIKFNTIESLIDSRCDKLYNEIKAVSKINAVN